mmetsp:Transcript_6544/g.10170  ORF Transcript_6544/g.10170 Transcript_6544/m.10170 type:complete len:707 (+) Transcript_6544:58-2178(+)|eukprot:CAMPEP_0184338196 /NCGR_PEP_ID=MMETSP1089-20130417/6712_1 /TAXON_ID=38269 ORGANISM="Gloeochaete wittrockiana, Strain SAG46.84" /NCGR_SAMPLE_ID=MMETSP1089 /ASSEMBLY_ACC=CAM_ASM_000445 /LENGTH=706 /DNA_ID=CAMNT_0026664535 /DNA_START=58 /DNA_END=2178 /DNA_ORIENTATION=-
MDSSSGGLPAILQLANSPQVELQQYAAAALRNLTVDASAQVQVVKQNGINALIYLARSADPTVLRNVAGTLRNLTVNDDIEKQIVHDGGLRPLIMLARSKDVEVQRDAAGALRNLSVNADNQAKILLSGGLPPLLSLARCDSADPVVLRDAAAALRNLTVNATNQDEFIRKGGLTCVLDLIRRIGDIEVHRHCAAALLNLSVTAENQRQIVDEGGLEPLVVLARSKLDAEVQSFAASALLHLSESPEHKRKLEEVLAMRGTGSRFDQTSTQAYSPPSVSQSARHSSSAPILPGHISSRSIRGIDSPDDSHRSNSSVRGSLQRSNIPDSPDLRALSTVSQHDYHPPPSHRSQQTRKPPNSSRHSYSPDYDDEPDDIEYDHSTAVIRKPTFTTRSSASSSRVMQDTSSSMRRVSSTGTLPRSTKRTSNSPPKLRAYTVPEATSRRTSAARLSEAYGDRTSRTRRNTNQAYSSTGYASSSSDDGDDGQQNYRSSAGHRSARNSRPPSMRTGYSSESSTFLTSLPEEARTAASDPDSPTDDRGSWRSSSRREYSARGNGRKGAEGEVERLQDALASERKRRQELEVQLKRLERQVSKANAENVRLQQQIKSVENRARTTAQSMSQKLRDMQNRKHEDLYAASKRRTFAGGTFDSRQVARKIKGMPLSEPQEFESLARELQESKVELGRVQSAMGKLQTMLDSAAHADKVP